MDKCAENGVDNFVEIHNGGNRGGRMWKTAEILATFMQVFHHFRAEKDINLLTLQAEIRIVDNYV
ncbi:MAG: hypothetical protein IJV27_07515 [Prevotella sp.]|nr:hypothetical protein [Prevotella sp.]